jgi:hypothetical protein
MHHILILKILKHCFQVGPCLVLEIAHQTGPYVFLTILCLPMDYHWDHYLYFVINPHHTCYGRSTVVSDLDGWGLS